MLTLKYRLQGLEYILMLTGKFNVIAGNSGTGKTRLTRFIRNINRTVTASDKVYPSKIEAPEVFTPDTFLMNEGIIYVIDEHIESRELRSVLPAMERSRNYFIFIRREGDAELPYGVDHTFRLERIGNTISMLPYWDSVTFLRGCSGCKSCVTEDAGLGYQLAKKIMKDIPVTAAKSKSLLVEVASHHPERCIILFDKCGIGGDMNNLVAFTKRQRCVLFDTESLEYEIGKALFGDDYAEYSTDNCLDFISAEDFYIQQLRELLRERYGCVYSKSDPSLVDILTSGKGIQHGVPISIPLQKVQQIYAELRTVSG